MIQEPRTIFATVGNKVLDRAADLFDHSFKTIVSELLQNARRAKATSVDITIARDDPADKQSSYTVTFTDNGEGIERPEALLAFGGSDWSEEVNTRENSAGMGFFSLSSVGASVRSRNWEATVTPQAFRGADPVLVYERPLVSTTQVRFPWTLGPWTQGRVTAVADHTRELTFAVEFEGRYFHIPITLNGEPIEQEDYLKGAVCITQTNGVRIGVFEVTGGTMVPPWLINFYGHRIGHDFCAVREAANQNRRFYAAIDIIDAPDFKLVLPTRNKPIENAYLGEIEAAARLAVYTHLTGRTDFTFRYDDFIIAKDLGLSPLPPKSIELDRWEVSDGYSDTHTDRRGGKARITAGETADCVIAFFPVMEDCHERTLGGALNALQETEDLPFELVLPHPDFTGYEIYDSIPTATFTYEVRSGANSLNLDPYNEKRESSMHSAVQVMVGAKPHAQFLLVDAIDAILTLPNGERFRVPINTLIVNDDRGDSARAAIVRTATPQKAASDIMEFSWYTHEDDERDDLEREKAAVLESMCNLLLPATRAQATNIAYAIREHIRYLMTGASSVEDGARDVICIDVQNASTDGDARSLIVTVRFMGGIVEEVRV